MITDWLIGSRPNMPACPIDVTVGGVTESFSIATGNYYLARAAGPLDLIETLVEEINAHSGISGVRGFLTRNRRVYLEHDSIAFAVSFTGDLTARNMLGWNGNLASATTHTAPAVSAFLWSPGKQGSPDAQLGTHGNRVYDTVAGQSGTGVVRSVRHYAYRENEWKWSNIAADRTHTPSGEDGEYSVFWEEVISRDRRFWVYRDVDEDGTGTFFSASGSYGPYQWRSPKRVRRFKAPREIKNLHVRNRVDLPVNQVPEYT